MQCGENSWRLGIKNVVAEGLTCEDNRWRRAMKEWTSGGQALRKAWRQRYEELGNRRPGNEERIAVG
jgi:hypothetical protein